MSFQEIADTYATWWIDFLGEHNHIGGETATAWLLERSGLTSGARMLDAGGFVGAAARLAARSTGAKTIVTDMNHDFLAAGRALDEGGAGAWVTAANERLPFATGTFDSVWCLDSAVVPREFTRVAAARATLCLCCEAPSDGRGGLDAFFDEWAELGWELTAHRAMNSEATQTWRQAEAELARRRPHFEKRYGTRPYLGQLDLVASLVQSYERGLHGHGLFVFRKR